MCDTNYIGSDFGIKTSDCAIQMSHFVSDRDCHRYRERAMNSQQRSPREFEIADCCHGIDHNLWRLGGLAETDMQLCDAVRPRDFSLRYCLFGGE